MANLRVSLRKKGASNFETGDKFLPETDWGFVLNKPATFVPDPHNHPISQVTGLQGVLDSKANLAGADFTGGIGATWFRSGFRHVGQRIISSPTPDFGSGRTFVRLWETSAGAGFISGKISISGIWSYSAIMGILEIETGIYVAQDSTSISYGNTRLTSATSTAIDNLRIGNLEVVSGYVGFYIYSQNSNNINISYDLNVNTPSGTLLWTNTSWESIALPIQRAIEFQTDVKIQGQSVILNNDARLTNARPASDVYAWAKEVNKPTYNWGEITSKPSWIGANKPTYDLGEISETTTYKRVTQSEKNTWNGKENAITKGTSAQYFRGDMSLATFPTIPTIPSLMTQADITNSTTTQRTINGSTLNANFYDKTSIDTFMSGKQNSLGFTPVPNTRTIAGLDLTANRTRDQILGVSANGYLRRTGANAYDIRTVANLKSDLGLGTLAGYNSLALNDLSNVTLGGTPTAGQVLSYGAGVWTNITPAYMGMGISRTISADNTYDLLTTDLNKLIIVNPPSGCAFQITTTFNNAAAIGSEVQFFKKNASAVELYSTASGVSVLSEGGKIAFGTSNTMVAIKKISSTEWIMVGAIT